MARGAPKAKRWRRLGVAPTPKIARILRGKPYPPGQHGRTRRRIRTSAFGTQLTEKQRLQAQYGVSERQLRNYVRTALRQPENAATALLQLLERRLSSVVYRAFAPTIESAQQYVSHGHVHVNGKRVNVSSYLVEPSDTVSFATRSEALKQMAHNAAVEPPPYLDVDREALSATLQYLPVAEEVPVLADIRRVIEFYSR